MTLESEFKPVCQRLLAPKCMAEIFRLSLTEIHKLPIPRVIVAGLARWRPEDVDAFIAASVVPYDRLEPPQAEAGEAPGVKMVSGIGVPIEAVTDQVAPERPVGVFDLLRSYRDEVGKHGPMDLAARTARAKLFSVVDLIAAE